jgi:hypothetical protein
MSIYISNEEDEIEDELIAYIEEKRGDKRVSKITSKLYKNYLLLFKFFL